MNFSAVVHRQLVFCQISLLSIYQLLCLDGICSFAPFFPVSQFCVLITDFVFISFLRSLLGDFFLPQVAHMMFLLLIIGCRFWEWICLPAYVLYD